MNIICILRSFTFQVLPDNNNNSARSICNSALRTAGAVWTRHEYAVSSKYVSRFQNRKRDLEMDVGQCVFLPIDSSTLTFECSSNSIRWLTPISKRCNLKSVIAGTGRWYRHTIVVRLCNTGDKHWNTCGAMLLVLLLMHQNVKKLQSAHRHCPCAGASNVSVADDRICQPWNVTNKLESNHY